MRHAGGLCEHLRRPLQQDSIGIRQIAPDDGGGVNSIESVSDTTGRPLRVDRCASEYELDSLTSLRVRAARQFLSVSLHLSGDCGIGTVDEREDRLRGHRQKVIWRVDLAEDGLTASARVWHQHESMAFDPDNPLNPQPGVNGV